MPNGPVCGNTRPMPDETGMSDFDSKQSRMGGAHAFALLRDVGMPRKERCRYAPPRRHGFGADGKGHARMRSEVLMSEFQRVECVLYRIAELAQVGQCACDYDFQHINPDQHRLNLEGQFATIARLAAEGVEMVEREGGRKGRCDCDRGSVVVDKERFWQKELTIKSEQKSNCYIFPWWSRSSIKTDVTTRGRAFILAF